MASISTRSRAVALSQFSELLRWIFPLWGRFSTIWLHNSGILYHSMSLHKHYWPFWLCSQFQLTHSKINGRVEKFIQIYKERPHVWEGYFGLIIIAVTSKRNDINFLLKYMYLQLLVLNRPNWKPAFEFTHWFCPLSDIYQCAASTKAILTYQSLVIWVKDNWALILCTVRSNRRFLTLNIFFSNRENGAKYLHLIIRPEILVNI